MSVSAPDGSAVLERGRRAARRPAAPAQPARPTAKAAAPAASAASPAAPAPGRSILEEEPPARRSLIEVLGVWGFAVLVHVVVLLGLSFVVIDNPVRDQIFSILGKPADEPDDAPILMAIEMPTELNEVEEASEIAEVASENVAEESSEMPLDINDLDPSLALEAADVGQALNVKLDSVAKGRSAKARAALVEVYGGNAASEQAVATGLKWLAERQRADGSWDFDDVGDEAEFDKEGKTEVRSAPMGATGAALLAFLGAGHTHTEAGPYRENVKRGLQYLIDNVRVGPAGADLRGGVDKSGMYIQGVVAIALAEAHGMTSDRRLRRIAEASAAFIANAQSPLDGGWRYIPAFEKKTPEDSDTSVVGWQLIALKSAQAAKIKVPKKTLLGVANFLDLASYEDGARYAYLAKTADNAGGPRPPMDAVGLLCRMYMGWDEDDPRLAKGVELLAERGPDRNDSYYAYYATQVMHHWGGEKWTAWNAVQRDYLVNTQERAGAQAGSWNPGRSHNDTAGGRLWVTCLSVMTLEVYYRHLPIYERGSLQVEF